MSLIICYALLFGIPLLCWMFGPYVGDGGREVLGFMWLLFGCFPCVIAGEWVARAIERLIS